MKITGFKKPSYAEAYEKARLKMIENKKKNSLEKEEQPDGTCKKPTKPKAKKKAKEKKWKSSYADNMFSKWIRERDGKCLRCGSTENLTCSHFWGRGNSSTRFDPLNCDTLCMGPYSNHCHDEWEIRKNNEYKQFKLNQLGQDGYDALERKARTFMKREDAIQECKILLKQQKLDIHM